MTTKEIKLNKTDRAIVYEDLKMEYFEEVLKISTSATSPAESFEATRFATLKLISELIIGEKSYKGDQIEVAYKELTANEGMILYNHANEVLSKINLKDQEEIKKSEK